MNRPWVLIVEDDGATRAALLYLFARRGWDAIATETVAGALARLDPPPAAVVLDLKLPDGDGEVVLRAIRDKGLSTRVAICSGSPDARRFADLGPLLAEAVLEKPVSAAAVFRACEATS